MHDELLALYGSAFTAAAERLVEQHRPEFEHLVRCAFDTNRNQPRAPCDVLPIVGMVRDLRYDPHASWQSHRELEALVVQALCCRKWFECEAAPWANPLPLTPEECIACYNRGGDRRSSLVGNYAEILRGRHWQYHGITPFEVWIAETLAPTALDE